VSINKSENSTNPYKSPQVYWCAVCDANRIDSTKPETGVFYQVAGHELQSGDYNSVFFAICPDCNALDALHTVKVGKDKA
jgi:hypothetical protein